jgi:hypothetical protein
MTIHLGGGAVSKLMLGASAVQRAYLGATQVYDSASGPTLADVEAVPEVEAVFLARPGDLFVSGGGNVAALDDLVAEWRSTGGGYTLTATNGTGIYWKNDGDFDRVKFENAGHLELTATPDGWAPPMLLAAAFVPESDYGTVAASCADGAVDDHYSRIYAEPGVPIVGFETRVGNANVYTSGDGGSVTATGRVVLATLDGGTATARVDGVDYAATADLYAGRTGDVFAVGGLSDTTPFSGKGAVAAVVVTDGLPSTADRDTIEQWLASLVGVSL